MSQISLLPQEYRNIAARRKKKSFYSVFGISLIALLVILNILFYIIGSSYRKERDSLIVQKGQLDTMVHSYGKYSAVYDTIKEYEGYLKTATAVSFDWSKLLDEISMTIPQGMWFDTVVIEYDGKVAKFNIKGKVSDKMLVSNWLFKTEENKVLTNTNIKYLQSSQVRDVKIVNFEVTGNVDISKIKNDRRIE